MAQRSSQHTKKRSTRRNGSETTGASSESRRRTTRSSRTRDSRDARDDRDSRQSRTSETRTSRQSRTAEDSRSKQKSARASAREERQRKRTKERAAKMYDRQEAIASRNRATEADGAPRAALYEGKMGSKHRKSARMQRASEAGPVSAKINPAGWFSALSNAPISRRTLRLGTAVLCVFLTALFLYVPAQHYYQAQREHDRLVAEYSVVTDRNSALDFENDSLASDAGMEDAVREKYGYVVSGEQTVVVTGLSDETLEQVHGASDVEANVLSSSVKAPEEWYTPYLDAFFGVS